MKTLSDPCAFESYVGRGGGGPHVTLARIAVGEETMKNNRKRLNPLTIDRTALP